MTLPLKALQAADRRSGERMPLTLAVQLRTGGMIRLAATLVDLSTAGARVRCEVALLPGSYCLIAVAGFQSFDASVAWSDGSECGLRFARPLHPAVVDHLARQGVHENG